MIFDRAAKLVQRHRVALRETLTDHSASMYIREAAAESLIDRFEVLVKKKIVTDVRIFWCPFEGSL